MGMCKPSNGKIDVFGKYGRSIKDIESSVSNIRVDYYDEKTGKLLQQRWYGKDKKAIWDRDWDHQDAHDNHKFPHDHPWDYTKKKPRQKSVPEINNDYC